VVINVISIKTLELTLVVGIEDSKVFINSSMMSTNILERGLEVKGPAGSGGSGSLTVSHSHKENNQSNNNHTQRLHVDSNKKKTQSYCRKYLFLKKLSLRLVEPQSNKWIFLEIFDSFRIQVKFLRKLRLFLFLFSFFGKGMKTVQPIVYFFLVMEGRTKITLLNIG
jgi:hypothetical protein